MFLLKALLLTELFKDPTPTPPPRRTYLTDDLELIDEDGNIIDPETGEPIDTDD